MSATNPADARYAIYYAPEVGTPLDIFGQSWMGRDAAADADVEKSADGPLPCVKDLTPCEVAAVLSAVARYGFHGTLKAPFFLRSPDLEPALIEEIKAFAKGRRPFCLPPLRLRRMKHFLALMPEGACAPLDDLAEACVRHFDPYRKTASAAELARRRAAGLSARQERHLERWGYPYVLDEFRFHLTLAGPLNGDDVAAKLMRALNARLGAVDLDGVAVNSICLFIQERRDRPFRCHSRYPFGGTAADGPPSRSPTPPAAGAPQPLERG
jgi:putative phosphonate metabolism protein